MKLSVNQRLALESLARHPDGAVASTVGAEVWGRERGGRVSAVHGGGDYAAQMLLGRLRKAGLAQDVGGAGATRWGITAAGRAALRKDAGG